MPALPPIRLANDQIADIRAHITAEVDRALAENAAAVPADVYRERHHLIAHLAALYPAVLDHNADPDNPGWPVIFIGLPTGQVSWHINPADLDLFAHVPARTAHWDGHTTAEKYQRLDQATVDLAASHAQPPACYAPHPTVDWARCELDPGHDGWHAHTAGAWPPVALPLNTPTTQEA
jgi:hypothetical protein